MRIELDHPQLHYCGRIDDRNPKQPEFIFPATSVRFRFFGKKLTLTVENRYGWGIDFVGTVIDGEQKKWELAEKGETTLVLLDCGEDAEHEVLIFKRKDGSHEFILKELTLSEGARLLESAPNPARRIEVYGDSVSAGEVSEAVEYVGKPDPEDHNCVYSNSWYSYAWILARKLNASLHDTAQGGIALMDGTGYFYPPGYWGMESAWDKVHYNPDLCEVSDWDFSRYTPHLVIVAIGQNDAHPHDFMKEDAMSAQSVMWREKYETLIRNLREKYPRALILLTTTILEHDRSWDDSIEAVCKKLGDERVRHFLYQKNGCGTPGHIRIPEAEQMADELYAYLEQLEAEGVEIWEEK